MLNKTIYAIPGLGVDERVFHDLDLSLKVHYLNWISPIKGESLLNYAKRMAASIPNDEASILLGMSFGGVLAQEIASFKPIDKLILVSSIKNETEKPWELNLMKHLPLYYLSQGNWRITVAGWMAPQYGIHKEEEIALLKDMFRQFDDDYRMWAIRQMCEWEGKKPGIPFLHLHGDRDKIIPIKNIKNAQVIKDGNHFMVKQRANEISELVNEWLEE